MRFVTLHGLSVLNRRYQSVLIKCLLAGMVFLPRAANADLNFKDGILTVDQDTVLENPVENVKTITFDDGKILDGQGHILSGSDGENLTLSTSETTSGGSLNDFDAHLNNITIKSGSGLTVSTGGGTLNLFNSTLQAGKTLTAGNLDATNSTLIARNQIKANNINVSGTLTVDTGDIDFYVNQITGDDGATVSFKSKSTIRLKSENETLKILNVLLDFGKEADAVFYNTDFTNTRIRTELPGKEDSSHIRLNNTVTFNGDNTITADGVLALAPVTVSADSSLTLKNIDGTGNGVLNGDLNLYGHFTGDMQGDMEITAGNNRSFNGKFDGGEITVKFTDSDLFDLAKLNFTQDSTINVLFIDNESCTKPPRVIVNSDFSVNELMIFNYVESSETLAQITGTGTLKTSSIYLSNNGSSNWITAYFDGINIAALHDDLKLDSYGYHNFTNNAISAKNNIKFNKDLDVTFNGNSSLTATLITAGNMIVNGALTVNGELNANDINLKNGGTLSMNGKLNAGQIIGGTLNIILPETTGTSPIITAKAQDVTLTLDLKNVTNKDAAQKYLLTNSTDGYTISGNYKKWAFSADNSFTLEDWKADKDKYLLSNVWGNSNGTLWILKVAGGAESAINDLRMAGIYVSPTEENASKILDLISNNPFADRLTDLLDSGDAGLQKQALREIAPTDAASSAFKTAKSAAHAVMNAVSDRLGGASGVSGRSGGDLTAGESAAWAQGMFNRAKMTGGDGFTSGTAGFSAGVETNLTDEIKAGFGYAFASTGIKTGRSKINADTHTGFVYGEYAPGALYVNAMLAYGRSDYDDKAKLSGMKNSYKADTYSARVAAGYDMGTLTPEAALRFTAVRQSAYTDDLGARVSAKNLNTTTAVVGAKAGKDFAAGKYTVLPEMKAALTYDLARPNESRMVALPDGSSYVAAGEHLNRLGFEVGAKAAVRLTNEVELSLSYDGAFKEHYQDHTGLINVKVDF